MTAGDRALAVRTIRTAQLDEAGRSAIVQLCLDAHENPDFANLFSYLPPDDLHVLGFLDGRLIGHAVVGTRWLQPAALRLLRTAYVDAVSVSPQLQMQGHGSTLMSTLASAIVDYDIGCLATDTAPGFYARLGWELWRGPLAGRSNDGLIPTPDEHGVMVLRLPRTPELDLDGLLTIEVSPHRVW